MTTSLAAIKGLHYGYSLGIALLVSISTLARLFQAKVKGASSPYVAELVVTVASAVFALQDEARLVHLVLATAVWLVVATRRHDGATLLFWGTCSVTLLAEIPLLVLTTLGNNLDNAQSIAALVFQAARLLAVVFLAAAEASCLCRRQEQEPSEVSQPILEASSSQTTAPCDYGTTPSRDDPDADDVGDESDSGDDDVASIKRKRARRLQETGGWLGYLKDFSIFIPFLIPKHDRKVQFAIFCCLLSLAGKRVLNVLIPTQLGIVTDMVLAKESPYGALLVYLGLSLLDGESGLGLIESLAKIPINQFSYRQVTNAAFAHVMSLSMDFHADRDSAEVMKAVEQGEALSNLLETAVFDILPTVVDMVVAFWMLYWRFDIYLALAMLGAFAAFTALEVHTSNTNIANRRASSKANREEARVMHQAVQGWQTVVYFNMVLFECRRYGQAVEALLAARRRYGVRNAFVQALLESTVPCAFFVVAAMVLRKIAAGSATAGDFVFLLQYWEILIWPMKWLSHNYRYLMNDLVDAERLLALLQTKPTIVDKEDAEELRDVQGHVAFEDISFAYDPRRSTIRGLSMSAGPGQTVALVGETGAGKSSIVKLLLRFYDVGSGRITIDGHDIRDVTLGSLRDALGVVPQDPLLFNATVMENLRYARPSATDAEVFEACRQAAIHDRIMSFGDGYETKVGEQGVKLSGGEIQRLAIARVFLKNPPVLILDEATSAVDTITESSIQDALDVLKKGRTTFVIAHRLSTVVNADSIMVIHDGQVVESGTHAQLLEREESRYKDLWTMQIGGAPEKNKL